MKILFLSEACLIKYGLKCGFDQLGHETDFLKDEYHAIWLKNPEQHFLMLLNKIDEFNPDFIFTEGYPNLALHMLYPELMKRSIPLFTWDIEADCTPQIGEYFVKNSDFIFTTMEEKVPDFINRGYKSDVLLFGCNPEFHKPVQSEDRFRHDLSLVARNYSNRYDYSKWFVLDILAKKKFDFMIYGIWWMDIKRPVNLSNYKENYWTEPGYEELPYEWLPIVVNSSKVIMGMNVPVNSNSHCSMRPFETMACSDNSIMVAHYQKGQKNIFGDLMYHVNNTDEAEMAINEILSMTDEQRKEKAKIAREFVYTNHNYKLRAEKVIDVYNKHFGG